MHVLGTAAARTTWTEASSSRRDGSLLHELVFEDWTVDGVPLRELVTARRETPNPVQEMTPLCELEPWPQTAVESLRRLLGDESGDFDDGRVSLLVCPIDADLGCRALSMTLVVGIEAVEWRDLGWQVDYQPFVAADGGFDPPIHFRFDTNAYTPFLRALLGRFEEMVSEQAARKQGSGHRFWRR